MKGTLTLLCMLVCVLAACNAATPEPTATVTSTHTATPIPTASATTTPSPTATLTPAPAPECSAADVEDAPWNVEVFDNAGLDGEAALICAAAAIGFDQQVGYPLVTAFATDFISSRWTATQELEAGRYTFTARSDDGIRVFVDDEPIIDEWKDQSAKVDLTGEVNLEAGEHTIVVEHYNGEGETRLSVRWESTPPTATLAPRTAAPVATVAAPAATAAPTEADELAQWNPTPLRVDCLGGGLCGFIFTLTFASKDYFHRIEFVDDAGNSIILGIESTFNNYVALTISHELKPNLQYGVPYRWRILLYRAVGASEELAKRGPLSTEPFVLK